MTEGFSKQCITGWIKSSEGYSLRVGEPNWIDYRDHLGSLRIDSEAMADPKNLEVVVYTGSIPDAAERPRAEVLDHLRRAFQFVGWKLTEEDAWFE